MNSDDQLSLQQQDLCNLLLGDPALRVETPNVPGPQYQVEYTIRVFEDPVENNTGLTAESIALEILAWLDGAMLTGNATILADTHGPALRPVYEYADRFAYDVVFVAQSPQDSRDRTVIPALTDDGHGNLTLTYADPSAQIYYSINGPLPVIAFPNQAVSPTQTIGAPYAAPFKVNAGDTVRFFAYTPGLLPSFISCA